MRLKLTLLKSDYLDVVCIKIIYFLAGFLCLFLSPLYAGSALPPVLEKAWWLNANDPGSAFHSKKGFSHLKFDNSQELVIAVVDTGIDFSHPFLKDHQYLKNGKAKGYNFYSGSNSVSDMTDYFGHGTHVAGIILAAAKRVNPKANIKFIAIKVLPDPEVKRTAQANKKKIKRKDPALFGYYTKEAAIYLARLKKSGVNILAVNASFGGSEHNKDELKAVDTLLRNDILLVAASGNEGNSLGEGNNFYPAGYSSELPGVISVGNITRNGELNEISNYGKGVSILAPGSDIMSTIPGGSYRKQSGTSMATPVVTAAVSLLKAQRSDLNTLEIKNLLIKNSRFNAAYLSKTGAASKLDMNLLFRPKKNRYNFKELPKLARENFTNSDAKVIKNTACIKAPASKILCGAAIYDKVLSVNGSKKSIVDIAGEHNLEALRSSYMHLERGEKIIDSSLGSLIHSISKNDKIYQRMLVDGFSFRDLYSNLGSGMLSKYYDGHIIIPVLTKKEFISNYPFRLSKKDKGDGAYAKYIEGLVNAPPQFLDKIGSSFTQRTSPLLKVEASLVQSFPLPVSSHMASYMVERLSPDMISTIKAASPKAFDKLAFKNLKKKLDLVKELEPEFTLTKEDVRYLEAMKKASRSVSGSLSSSLGSGSSMSAGISPKTAAIRKEAESALIKPVKITAVNGAKPIDKNQQSIPVVPQKIANSYKAAEALLKVSMNNARNKQIKKVTGKANTFKQFDARYKIGNKTYKTKMNLDLSNKKLAEFRENSLKERHALVDDMMARTNESRDRSLKYSKALNSSPSVKSEGKSRVRIARTRYSKPKEKAVDTAEVKSKTVTRMPDSVIKKAVPSPVKPDTTDIDDFGGIKKQYNSDDQFLCHPDKYDELFKQMNTDIESKNLYLDRIFCANKKQLQLHELKKASSTMSHYNMCRLRSPQPGKTFEELVAPGFRKTACDQDELLTSCSRRMRFDLKKMCNKILSAKDQYVHKEPFHNFISRCHASALNMPGVKSQYVATGPALAEFMKKYSKLGKARCRSLSFFKEKNPKLVNHIEALAPQVRLPYRAKVALSEIKKDPENLEVLCKQSAIFVRDLESEYVYAIETGKTLNRHRPSESTKVFNSLDKQSVENIKVWLLTNNRLAEADKHLYSCVPKTTGGNTHSTDSAR